MMKTLYITLTLFLEAFLINLSAAENSFEFIKELQELSNRCTLLENKIIKNISINNSNELLSLTKDKDFRNLSKYQPQMVMLQATTQTNHIIMDALMENNPSVELYADITKKTLLHHAMGTGNLDMVKFLLNNQKTEFNKRNIFRLDRDFKTPLDIGIEKSRDDCCVEIIKYISSKDNWDTYIEWEKNLYDLRRHISINGEEKNGFNILDKISELKIRCNLLNNQVM